MFGREELYILGDGETATYYKSEVDTVMDAMEAKIKELEKQLEDTQYTMADKNTDLGMENFKLKERVNELENKLYGSSGQSTRLLNRINNFRSTDPQGNRLDRRLLQMHPSANGNYFKNGNVVVHATHNRG